MNIVMIGAGYVGLTTGACLAELGHAVVCVDIDAKRIETLRRGDLPIYEPGLAGIVERNVAASRLAFSSALAEAVGLADAVFLAVGTPTGPNGDIDLSYIEAAARQVAPALKSNAVVVVKSTVVTGTCRALREIIAERRGGLDFSVASNPEFLREGSAVEDFLNPDRVVIGTDDPRAGALLEEVYAPLRARGVTVLCTSTANAELVKYAANAFLALKIGFINDVANLCEATGGDVGVVAQGIGLDRRIGQAFLAAGPGFGGSCFPKDTRAFVATGRKHGAPQALIEALVERNEHRKRSLARRILAEIGAHPKGATVAVLGLAFKANTDDVREAPALTMIPELLRAGVRVRAHDPKAMREAARQLEGVSFHASPYAAARGADLVLILTEWDEYRHLDLGRIKRQMSGHTIVDYRNLFHPQDVERRGFRYVSLGRPAVPPEKLASKVIGKAKPVRPAIAAGSEA